MAQWESNFLRCRQILVCRIFSHILPALHDNEHVIDPDAEADEGQDGVHGGVGEAEDGGEPHRGWDSHSNAGQAGQREVNPHLQPVQLSQHEDGVGEHDQVAAGHQEGVKEDCLRADVGKALASVGDDAAVHGGAV